MNLDLNKLTCTASLTDTERAVLEFLLTHIDEALKLGGPRGGKSQLYLDLYGDAAVQKAGLQWIY